MEQGRESAAWFVGAFDKIRREIAKVIVGQEPIVDSVLVAVATGGHALLEGAPGLGKTLLVRTLAQTLDLQFSRIQFTPDLMPADVTGTDILVESDTGARAFTFRPGPVFTNVLLADEINRATPKTQSALLEAMQEHSVTVGGKRHAIEAPFWVLATQNPIEMEGTYPLPEAQLDRFLFKVMVPSPTLADLREIANRTTGAITPETTAVAGRDTLLRMQEIVRKVPVAQNVQDFALKLIVGTHPQSEMASNDVNRYVRYGASPRGAQALLLAAKVYALLDNRNEERFNVSVDDIKKAAKPALRHRLLLNFEAEADGITPDALVERLIAHVEKSEPEPVRA